MTGALEASRVQDAAEEASTSGMRVTTPHGLCTAARACERELF